jgi:hypothetical protein
MTSPEVRHPATHEICTNVKKLGYVISAHIRLYGEEFEVLSDPVPESGGIALRVKARKDSRICVVQLPATVLQSLRGRVEQAA